MVIFFDQIAQILIGTINAASLIYNAPAWFNDYRQWMSPESRAAHYAIYAIEFTYGLGLDATATETIVPAIDTLSNIASTIKLPAHHVTPDDHGA